MLFETGDGSRFGEGGFSFHIDELILSVGGCLEIREVFIAKEDGFQADAVGLAVAVDDVGERCLF